MLCFRKLLVAKSLWIRGGGEYQDLPLIIFCLTVQKKIRRATILCSTEIPVSKKFMEERGGGTRISCRKVFVSQCRKGS